VPYRHAAVSLLLLVFSLWAFRALHRHVVSTLSRVDKGCCFCHCTGGFVLPSSSVSIGPPSQMYLDLLGEWALAFQLGRAHCDQEGAVVEHKGFHYDTKYAITFSFIENGTS
jgi:hypothetical protein